MKLKSKIYCPTLDREFDTLREASEYTGVATSNLSNCINGKTKTAGRLYGLPLQWEYKDPYSDDWEAFMEFKNSYSVGK